jgi:hypothetical protein
VDFSVVVVLVLLRNSRLFSFEFEVNLLFRLMDWMTEFLGSL